MDQTHIGYTYWQEPPRNTMPRVDVIQLPTRRRHGRRGGRAESPRRPRRSRRAAVRLQRELVACRRSTRTRDRPTTSTSTIEDRPRSRSRRRRREPWVVVSPAKRHDRRRRNAFRSASIGRTRPSARERVPITITGPNGRENRRPGAGRQSCVADARLGCPGSSKATATCRWTPSIISRAVAPHADSTGCASRISADAAPARDHGHRR